MTDDGDPLAGVPDDEVLTGGFVPADEMRRILAGCRKCNGDVDTVVIMAREQGGAVVAVFGVCAACEIDLGSRAEPS